jgi:diketogulonate reductase-like aldo/keto reductase
MDMSALDLLQFHWWDYADRRYLDALAHLADLRGAGQIRHLGLTNFDTAHVQQIVEAGVPVVSNQVQFSLIDRRPERGMAPFCREHGIGLLAYGTVCGGLLSDRYLGQPEPDRGALATASLRKYKQMIDAWGGWELFQELLRAAREVADRHRTSIAGVAIGWVLDRPAVKGAILGVRLGVSDNRRDNARVLELALDAHDVGRLKDVHGRVGRPGNYALEVAAGIAAGIAEAIKPGATVGGVIDTVRGQLSSAPRQEVEQGLAWAKEHADWRDLRPLYEDRYRGHPISNAVEILSSALAVFYLADGEPKQALLASVNFGRDCDCRAYVAGGLSATLSGSATLPRGWIDTIEQELPTDPYTVSRRSLKDTAGGLYRATLNTLQVAKRQVEQIEALL